jgi:conserved domain protein
MINKKFNSISEILEAFPDEQSCIDHLESLRWGGNVVSPFDSSSKVYKCRDNKYRCKNTGKYFNVRTNTIFDNTRVKLSAWFCAIWLITVQNENISSIQLAQKIGVTQKTAWAMIQRIKKYFGM